MGAYNPKAVILVIPDRSLTFTKVRLLAKANLDHLPEIPGQLQSKKWLKVVLRVTKLNIRLRVHKSYELQYILLFDKLP